MVVDGCVFYGNWRRDAHRDQSQRELHKRDQRKGRHILRVDLNEDCFLGLFQYFHEISVCS